MTTPPHRPLAVVFHPSFEDFAGAEMVTAWTLQALRETHEVCLWAEHAPDWAKIDARFATDLARNPPRLLLPTKHWRCLKAVLQDQGRLVLHALTQRELRAFHHRHAPAIWLATYNETWLPTRGLLYIHHPERLTLPEAPAGWPWWRRTVFTQLRRLAFRVGLSEAVPPSQHRKLINSRWCQRTYASAGGGDAHVVYPPVPPFAEGLPWDQRENRVVMLGRWAVPKRLTLAIEIIAEARRRGASLTLAFVGFWHSTDTERANIQKAADGHDWIEWHERPSRAEVEALAGRSRYGLHAMENEHFGIAVAELATAGCIVLVPASGGPPEIVDEPAQTFGDAEEAVSKLLHIVNNAGLQTALHARARDNGLRFAPERFVSQMQDAVNEHS